MPPLACTAQQGPGKSPNPSEWFALTQHYARARRLPYESYCYICIVEKQVFFELGWEGSPFRAAKGTRSGANAGDAKARLASPGIPRSAGESAIR